MHLPRIAITMGDPAGIGAETAVKAIASGKPAECCLPVLIGERRAVEDAMSFCGLSLPIREVEGFAGADPACRHTVPGNMGPSWLRPGRPPSST